MMKSTNSHGQQGRGVTAANFRLLWLILIGGMATLKASSADSLKVTQALATHTVALEFTSLTLSCQFDPTPGYVIWSFSPPGQPVRTLIRCQPAKNSCGQLVDAVGGGFANVTARPNGSLTIPRLTQSHSGRYRCEALLQLDSARTEAEVTVLVAPTLPLIAAPGASSLGVVEGSNLSLTCSTSGGNPPPTLTWWLARAGEQFQPISADPTAETLPAAPFGAVTSSLTLPALRAMDNRAAVRCQALHPVANLTSADYLLNVLYKPIVKPMTSLAMELDTEVMIECSARGNPEPSVHLENSVGEILSAVSLASVHYKLIARQKSQSGQYQCAASNSQGAGEVAKFTLDVQYGPRVSGAGVTTVRAGDRLTTECSVDANPPAQAISWTHLPSGRVLTTGSKQLVIERADRTDAGAWRCLFRNVLSPSNAKEAAGAASNERLGYADTGVIVEYQPGLPTTSVGRTQLLRGDSVSVACSANEESPGVPSPNFRWSKSGSLFEALGPTLALVNVSIADSGVYFCTPDNTAGRGPSTSVSVDVEQPPDWLEAQPRQPITTPMTSADFQLVCSAMAKPEASFAWYKDGRLISPEWYQVETTSEPTAADGYRSVSRLKFRGTQRTSSVGGLRPEDNGKFLCEASNKRGKISAEIQLIVEFSPIIQPIETKIAKPDDSTVDFHCPVIGQPRPSITWQLAVGDDVTMTTGATPRFETDPLLPYRYVSRLEGVGSLGNYTCVATNILGRDQATFRVVKPTNPDPPTQLRVLASGWDFVTVAWQLAFNGGSPVQHWARVMYVDSAGGQLRSISRRCDTSTRTNVTGLLPGTNYTVQIYGLNDLGQSNYSSPISLVTASLALPKPTRVLLTGEGQKLTVAALTGYCMRVEASDDGGNTWSLCQYCVPSGVGEISGINSRLLYRVSLCLTQREDVCGLPTLSTAVSPLPEIETKTIIIVGGSCAGVIILLVSVLTYFCCKRPKVYKDIQEQMTAQDGQPTSTPQYQVSEGKPYVLVPPHQSFSADDIAAAASATNSNNSQKPLVSHSRSESSRRSSIVQSRDEHQQYVPTTAVTFDGTENARPENRRSGVFATLGSGHNPLDSSASNPALSSYVFIRELDYPDDNRNTDPYTFDGSSTAVGRQKKIIYEVVV